ncbi:MAG: pyruvate synthase subunit PorB [Candidatus Nanoarchaeia archaeon]|nr:pyruvate synthase subunit PorB [Candidatus Nanoarchaeia archaeon]
MIYGMPEEEYIAPGHGACAGCPLPIITRIITKASGEDTIIVNATSCLEVVTSPYPHTSWKLPWVHTAFENSAAVASGIEAAVKKSGKKTNILVFAGDGGTFDIGLQALSGMLERGHRICFVCFDNEAYMNTGVQRSGATPLHAWTTTTPLGKKERKKPVAEIIASHHIPYVASANPAYHKDLYDKVKKALSFDGPSFIHVYSPCVPGWKYESRKTIHICRLAVETGAWMLYEIENGFVKINRTPEKRIPVEEYLKTQKRFSHLSKKDIEDIENDIEDSWQRMKNLEKAKARI